MTGKKCRIFSNGSFQRLAEGAEGTVRRRREDGQYIWINIKAFFLREQDGHKMFYGAVQGRIRRNESVPEIDVLSERGN